MKQLVSIRVILTKGDKTLLARRKGGRQAIAGKYEVPGGLLGSAEQPEDAARRYLKDDIGVDDALSLHLVDAFTYREMEDRRVQYVFIVFRGELKGGVKVSLGKKYDRYAWRRRSDYSQVGCTEVTQLLLGIDRQFISDPSPSSDVAMKANALVSDSSHLIIYSDGGSRGNPGPSASGFVIFDSEQHAIEQGGVYLGITTNNQAEYHGVRLGLERALSLGAKTIDYRLDSLLVVNQMNGVYVVKNRELWPIHERIKELVSQFDKVTFSHVKRELNQLADGMVNKILDAEAPH